MFSAGERYVYKFVCDPEALFNMAAYSGSGSDGSTAHGLHHTRGCAPSVSSGAADSTYGDMLAMYNGAGGPVGSYTPLHHFQQYLATGAPATNDQGTIFRSPAGNRSAYLQQYPSNNTELETNFARGSVQDLSIDGSMSQKPNYLDGSSKTSTDAAQNCNIRSQAADSSTSKLAPGRGSSQDTATPHKLDPPAFHCLGVDSCVC
jgi:ets translocation variant 5